MRIGLFGGLQAHDGGRGLDLGGPKQRAVLAVLALDPGRAAFPSRLIDLVWGEHVPNRAEVSLQAYVSNLRRVLEPDRLPRQAPRLLLTHPAGYSLAVGREQVDVTRFEDLAARGHTLVLITHDNALAQRTRRIVQIQDGRIVEDRPTVVAA